MNKRTLRDLPESALKNKRVLVRVDFNVPLADGKVSDDTRIRATLPTLTYLLKHDARVVLFSHLGRPRGEWDASLSLRPVSERLADLVSVPVHFVEDVVGPDAHTAGDRLEGGEILVLENTRFLSGEETNDPELCEAMTALADVYVNDAFGAAHRAHASTSGVAQAMRDQGRPAVAGLLMEKELRFLGKALESPEAPFVSVLGGAKISGKIDVIDNLLPRLDRLLIGGAMANTFFRAMGLETGDSLVEEERIGLADQLLERAGDKLVLPVDCRVARGPEETPTVEVTERDDVPSDGRIMDVGPNTETVFGRIIDEAKTIVWNGPMGVFEQEPFRPGTTGIARAIAAATAAGATSIVGGGDTAAAAEIAGVTDRLTHVSTGGGASLRFLEGKTLPGVAVLSDRGGEG